jgi:hypothetical protein
MRAAPRAKHTRTMSKPHSNAGTGFCHGKLAVRPVIVQDMLRRHGWPGHVRRERAQAQERGGLAVEGRLSQPQRQHPQLQARAGVDQVQRLRAGARSLARRRGPDQQRRSCPEAALGAQ